MITVVVESVAIVCSTNFLAALLVSLSVWGFSTLRSWCRCRPCRRTLPTGSTRSSWSTRSSTLSKRSVTSLSVWGHAGWSWCRGWWYDRSVSVFTGAWCWKAGEETKLWSDWRSHLPGRSSIHVLRLCFNKAVNCLQVWDKMPVRSFYIRYSAWTEHSRTTSARLRWVVDRTS